MSNRESILFVTGVNHKTLSTEGREQCARLFQDAERFYEELRSTLQLAEFVVVSTCNRFEIVFADTVPSASDREAVMQQCIKQVHAFINERLEEPLLEDHFFSHAGDDAVRYVFRVSASLESMVLGESQILGQVKEAYRLAVRYQSCGKLLHRLFQSAFQLAKKVRAHTRIADKPVSISYVAVKLVEQIFGGVSSCKTLLLGSGHMAELAALHLVNYGCKELVIANRTLKHAEVLAERFQGRAIGLDEVDAYIADVDVVIGSLSIDRPLVELSKIQSMARKRALFFIDMGMPRNFPSALGELENIYLYNIDDFSAIVDEHKQVRERAAQDAEVVVDFAVHQYLIWLGRVHHEPTMLDLRSRIEAMCAHELEHFVSKESEEPEELIRRLSRKISHDVTNLFQEKVSRPKTAQDVLDDHLDMVSPYGRIVSE